MLSQPAIPRIKFCNYITFVSRDAVRFGSARATALTSSAFHVLYYSLSYFSFETFFSCSHFPGPQPLRVGARRQKETPRRAMKCIQAFVMRTAYANRQANGFATTVVAYLIYHSRCELKSCSREECDSGRVCVCVGGCSVCWRNICSLAMFNAIYFYFYFIKRKFDHFQSKFSGYGSFVRSVCGPTVAIEPKRIAHFARQISIRTLIFSSCLMEIRL